MSKFMLLGINFFFYVLTKILLCKIFFSKGRALYYLIISVAISFKLYN